MHAPKESFGLLLCRGKAAEGGLAEGSQMGFSCGAWFLSRGLLLGFFSSSWRRRSSLCLRLEAIILCHDVSNDCVSHFGFHFLDGVWIWKELSFLGGEEFNARMLDLRVGLLGRRLAPRTGLPLGIKEGLAIGFDPGLITGLGTIIKKVWAIAVEAFELGLMEGWDALENLERYRLPDEVELPDDFYGFERADFVVSHGDICGGHYYQWLLTQGIEPREYQGFKNALERRSDRRGARLV